MPNSFDLSVETHFTGIRWLAHHFFYCKNNKPRTRKVADHVVLDIFMFYLREGIYNIETGLQDQP